jgi:hypothetical protein
MEYLAGGSCLDLVSGVMPEDSLGNRGVFCKWFDPNNVHRVPEVHLDDGLARPPACGCNLVLVCTVGSTVNTHSLG